MADKGFVTTKNIVVVLRDVNAYELFVSDAIESGANNIYNVEFKTSELRKHGDNAGGMAIKAAKEEAMLMAKSLDRSIGGPLEISEQDMASACNGRLTGRMGAAGFRNAAADAGTGGGPEAGDTMAPGQIKVTARVVVVFELK
ncbi:MAG: SIMPL domain-containing protein [Spirochaetia bacterium]|nr:SIMPL domain-containing protein [Spirochaetia bacterium]